VQRLADEVRAGTSGLRSFVDIPTVAPENRVEWYVYVGHPTFLLFAAPDRVFWYRVLPDGPQRVKLLTTLLVLPESKRMPDFEQRLAAEVEMLKKFHTEDMEVCVAVQKGMNSSAYRPGRLSHLEVPIWHIQRFLARQLRGAAGAPDAGTADAVRSDSGTCECG
jgi:phenylpropionate dioxygenase-like ring-hydroxylating dioxygenase large terminal subunit